MLALLLLLQAPAQAPARLTGFLTQSIGLDAAQLATLERGEPVVKVLETHDRRDVAIFGVITASKSPADFARAARDFPAALRTPNRTGVGLFSTPAAPPDVAPTPLPRAPPHADPQGFRHLPPPRRSQRRRRHHHR